MSPLVQDTKPLEQNKSLLVLYEGEVCIKATVKIKQVIIKIPVVCFRSLFLEKSMICPQIYNESTLNVLMSGSLIFFKE